MGEDHSKQEEEEEEERKKERKKWSGAKLKGEQVYDLAFFSLKLKPGVEGNGGRG